MPSSRVASVLVAGLVGALLAATGCGDSGGGSPGTGAGGGGDGGSSSGQGGDASGQGGDAAGPSGSGGGATSVTSGGSSTSNTTGVTTGGTSTASASTGGGEDPYAAERQICIDKINALRATKGAPPYARWTEGELCADEEATSDEQSGTAHGAFGMCGESGQNECLGHGPAGIEQCLDQMWAEKDLPGCSGCDACAESQGGNCADCDFFGSETGDVCGHYVNMRALYFSQAACGFSAVGGWDVINFR